MKTLLRDLFADPFSSTNLSANNPLIPPLLLPSSPRLSRLKVEREKEVAEGLTKFDLRRMSRVVDAGRPSIFSSISIFLLRFLCYGVGVGGGFVRFAKIPRVFRDRVLEGEGKGWLVNSSDASWMHPVA